MKIVSQYMSTIKVKFYYISNDTADKLLTFGSFDAQVFGHTINKLFDFNHKDETLKFIKRDEDNDIICIETSFNSLENYKVEIAEYLV